MKSQVFTVLAMQGVYQNFIHTFREDMFYASMIHTGVRPGNMKPVTYFNKLIRLGYQLELQQLTKEILNDL